jgi:ribosomal protein L15
MPEREKLLAKQMEIFKAQNQQEYVKIVKAGQMVLQSIHNKFTKLAIEYIEITPENF